MSNEIRLKIADIIFSILPTGTIKKFSVEKTHGLFKTDEEPDIVLKAIRKTSLCIRPEKLEFDASTWDYFQADGRHIFNFSYPSKNKQPDRSLVLKPDFRRGEIILPESTRTKNGVSRNPFSYPLDQLLTIALLHQRQGFLIHSCGFTYKNNGYLSIGSSGAGKSTLAQILGKDKRIHVLNDEKIAARKRHGRFYIYGTPWHGTGGFVSPEKAPLKGLFFLKKDTKNHLQNLSVSDTVSRLIKCSFPPFWDREGMASTLKICENIATAIPCFEFSFTPDKSAFELIKEKL